tara:strand:- start:4646 stop:5362 length:717 start_codon:yes stop_codon:yes gene_type:complete
MALWNRNRNRKRKSKRIEDDAPAPESYNQKRRRRIRERAAIAKKEMLKPTPPVTPKGETEKERAEKMSTSTTVTAPRSAVKKTRESMSGPSARPASKLAGPPTPPKSDLKSSGTTTAPKGDIRTPTASIVGEKSTGASGAKDNPKSVLGGQKRAKEQGKKEGTGTFIGKDGRKKAAVTREDLEKSGLSLRDYLNKQRGLTRRKPNKKAKGGKVKAYKNGGTVRGAGIAKKGVRPCKMR